MLVFARVTPVVRSVARLRRPVGAAERRTASGFRRKFRGGGLECRQRLGFPGRFLRIPTTVRRERRRRRAAADPFQAPGAGVATARALRAACTDRQPVRDRGAAHSRGLPELRARRPRRGATRALSAGTGARFSPGYACAPLRRTAGHTLSGDLCAARFEDQHVCGRVQAAGGDASWKPSSSCCSCSLR